MRLRPLCKRISLLAVLAGLVAGSPAHALFYDPFPDAAAVSPSDELEERIWHEAEVFRAQFVRGQTPERLRPLQRSVRAVLQRHWPDLAPKLDLVVIDNADVVAVSSANGDIVVSTGMLMRLDNEEELVAVLAREVAHVLQRHAVRTVYAARVGAGANVVFQTVVKANSLISTAGLLTAFQVTPEMLLVDGGKAFIQAQLGRLKETMADNFVRRMSATGFDAMVKTSLFGYSEALETEADEYSLSVLHRRFGRTEAFSRVMQRLLDEARVDEKKFSAFYANEERLAQRVEVARRADAAATQASVAPVTGAGGPVASDPQVAVALPPGALELPSQVAVATVVVGDEAGGDEAAVSSTAIRAAAFTTSVAEAEAQPYGELLTPWALTVFETELEAGRLNRVMRNIERPRAHVVLPSGARVLLAEAWAAHPDATHAPRVSAELEAHVRAHPDDARALKLLGVMALRQGDLEAARAHLTRARELARTDEERGFIDQYLGLANKKPGSTS